MQIGCVKEIKDNEFRVGLVPATAASYIQVGNTVYIEKNAGLGSAISNEVYKNVGAAIVETAEEVWDLSDMIIKVKESLLKGYDLMKDGQIIYT